MRCEGIMKRDVHCVQPTDPVQAAARRMRDANIGFLPACDSSRKVLGAITDRDIAQVEDASRASQTMKQVTEREARAH